MTRLTALIASVVFLATFVMALSPRSAIHANDLERYDAFMADVQSSQYLHMFPENGQVRVDVYEDPSDVLAASGLFGSSEHAEEYFERAAQHAVELLSRDESASSSALLCSTSISPAPTPVLGGLEARLSRCWQFCGRVADCGGPFVQCPNCYYVGGRCRYQRSCQ